MGAAPYIEPIGDQKVVEMEYKAWRWRIFYSMFFGYMFYYFTRKSFTFSMPGLISDLGYDKADLGILASILSLSYGASKFVNGMIGDRTNPRYMMGIGLILTGIVNVFFGFSSSLILFAIFWGLNGWFQGFGWPPCARLLTHWYSQNERGSWWSSWNISHNLGGALIPLIAAWAATQFGWRYGMYIPGSLCIVGGLFLINRLRDTPQSLGLPSIEVYRQDFGGHQVHNSLEEKELSTRQALFEYVLKSPAIWLLAIAYLFIYVVRQAFNDWTPLYLIEFKGYQPFEASQSIFYFEMGGLLGSLVAGWFSDKLMRGKRGPMNVIFSFGLLICSIAFWSVPQGYAFLDYLSVFMIGFFVFGPQMMIGLAAAEISHKKAAATATGFLGFVAYVGAALSGYPLGKIAQVWGWEWFFISSIFCAAMATFFLLPTWNISQKKGQSLKYLR